MTAAPATAAVGVETSGWWNPQGLVIGCGKWEGGPQVKGIRCDVLCELWARGRLSPEAGQAPHDITVHPSQIWAQL